MFRPLTPFSWRKRRTNVSIRIWIKYSRLGDLTFYVYIHVTFLFMLLYVHGGSIIAGCVVLLVNSFNKTRAVFSSFESCIQFLFQLDNFILCLLLFQISFHPFFTRLSLTLFYKGLELMYYQHLKSIPFVKLRDF